MGVGVGVTVGGCECACRWLGVGVSGWVFPRKGGDGRNQFTSMLISATL